MTGRRGGRRRGKRGGRGAATHDSSDEEYPSPPKPQFKFPTAARTGSRADLNSAIRCVGNDTPTLKQQQHYSTSSIPPQVVEEVYVDVEVPIKFAPTDGVSFNITECTQKLREDMEYDPEEEEDEAESALEPGLEYVNEHRVKTEHAPLLRAIFDRYGDITQECRIKSPAILSFHLEYLCLICNKLEGTQFSHVTLIELEKLLEEVEDLEVQKLNVGWLRRRIQDVMMAKVDLGRYLAIKEEKMKLDERIKKQQQQLCVDKAKSEEVGKVALDIKRRVAYHGTHSLLHDLY